MATGGTPAPQRQMRADARRNYERLLDEARAAFAEQGVGTSLEEIARRAEVAIGTLYRHFPTRHALLEAILRDSMTGLSDRARELLDHPSPAAALTLWSRAALIHITVYRDLAPTLMSSFDDETSPLHSGCQALVAAGEQLLDRARQAGVVRADAQATDLFALLNAVAWVSDQVPDEQADRLLSFVVDGLRPRQDQA
ncbi:TetR/AcrR family transcriptional regulator [Micromonospora polyrhachis]|uniref:AcrR family transcriptional regulator n=1 Tax=Micromonospora polyrhachis TaxID=1282883 RepID=A0A7W7SRK7_9ACTN|nr:TetR/AcrR family transcriptional regulator [Micromonospora polyrhachis]MBB4959668.1 AcrR family transcriptional regulator [Micromonospora polyrhachis]